MANIPVERRGGGMWWLWLLLGLLVVGLLAWLLIAAMGGGRPRATTDPAVRGAAPASVTLATLARDPEEYYGKTVTVSGEITDIVSLNAVTLGDEVLVVTKQPLTDAQGKPIQAELYTKDTAQVTGTVREFDLSTFEQEAGVDLEDAKVTRWRGEPAILATSVQITKQ